MRDVVGWFRQLGGRVVRRFRSPAHYTAVFYPYKGRAGSYILPDSSHVIEKDAAGLPVPPAQLRLHGGTTEAYLRSGEELVARMKDIVRASGCPLGPGSNVLDLGCADGFMVRWLRESALTGEVWGADINGTHIVWCQQNLSPPFKFVATTSFPHLPFEDRHFDLIYTGSVFTHIADLAEAWLLELKRILKPGGKLYITIHDKNAIDIIMNGNSDLAYLLRSFDKKAHFTTSGFSMFTINRKPGVGAAGEAQVFYDVDYLRRHWGNYLTVVSVTPEAYGYQTAVVLEK